jgi:hypothetical protein
VGGIVHSWVKICKFSDRLCFASRSQKNGKEIMKKPIKLLFISYLFIYSFGATFLRADDLAVSLEAFKVTRGPAGAEVLTLAEQAAPGEMIEYRVVCKNPTSSAMGDVMAEVPVPDGLIWLASSDQPKATEARLADGRLVPMPALGDDGLPLSAELIRALRWKIERISAGESVVVSLRASVTR